MQRVEVGLWQERNVIEVVGPGGVALELITESGHFRDPVLRKESFSSK